MYRRIYKVNLTYAREFVVAIETQSQQESACCVVGVLCLGRGFKWTLCFLTKSAQAWKAGEGVGRGVDEPHALLSYFANLRNFLQFFKQFKAITDKILNTSLLITSKYWQNFF